MPKLFDELFAGGLDLHFDVHGEPVLYAATSQSPTAPWQDITGVFNPTHVDVSLGDVPVTAAEPVIDVRRPFLTASPARGDQVKIDGQIYTVVDIDGRVDGPVARLRLHRGAMQGV